MASSAAPAAPLKAAAAPPPGVGRSEARASRKPFTVIVPLPLPGGEEEASPPPGAAASVPAAGAALPWPATSVSITWASGLKPRSCR